MEIEEIDEYAFTGCTAMTQLSFPNTGDLHIYTGSFNGCSSLIEITLTPAIYKIDSNALR